MKDSLFALLLNLFEKTISQLKEQQVPSQVNAALQESSIEDGMPAENMPQVVRVRVEQVKSAKPDSIRVFTSHEQTKLTKASHQFLVRMAAWGVITPDIQELIINRLIFSDSRFVSLQETKWTIRNTLANGLSPQQLAFLEMVLYQKEDQLPLH